MLQILGYVGLGILLIAVILFIYFLSIAIPKLLCENLNIKESDLENLTCPHCGYPTNTGHSTMCIANPHPGPFFF